METFLRATPLKGWFLLIDFFDTIRLTNDVKISGMFYTNDVY